MKFFYFIAINFFFYCDSFTSYNRIKISNNKYSNDLKSTFGASDNVWDKKVQYVDLSSTSMESTPTSRPLPLFLLGDPFFPQGVTYLNVFEMKYRTMMFDVANSGDEFGYVHYDGETGRIAAVGTICKIIDRELLEDGRQFITVEGTKRFRINKILRTLPYVVAEVEPNFEDEPVENEIEANLIENDVYNGLKYYLRIMKTYDTESAMVISPKAKQNRPPNNSNSIYLENNAQRRSDFSFSIANMIRVTVATQSQLLLQTVNVVERLKIQLEILNKANTLVSDELLKLNVLTVEKRDQLRALTYETNYEDDILPVEVKIDKTNNKNQKDEWDLSNIE
jgi:Lon protease-like protein